MPKPAPIAQRTSSAHQRHPHSQPKDTVEALHASLLAYDNGSQTEKHTIHLRILWATTEHLVRDVSSGNCGTCEALAIPGPLETIH
jgi:hypothetical protein